ncbi:hypothetical protein TPHA_0D03340 [Tetrapisispora phaffii CBS 4417]|uniref:GH16 domain-containing protein n=1 Tax=Tetrapisispora phaffii (strain ATCC 24235 / CBS 4417 / NBRC 1672 / NRRL Y-8282 / UCD 70-5) TaxID=1071381 RepID=G8BSZ9_TETPH|nr:hypothetical protein TPHA_0D03340 [Tetrapisispora phaffii CBS 4417]CCE62970.1 hypothetical protein TPHA_0D03340 [Tetrapisispora phaffii CBS 4417]
MGFIRNLTNKNEAGLSKENSSGESVNQIKMNNRGKTDSDDVQNSNSQSYTSSSANERLAYEKHDITYSQPNAISVEDVHTSDDSNSALPDYIISTPKAQTYELRGDYQGYYSNKTNLNSNSTPNAYNDNSLPPPISNSNSYSNLIMSPPSFDRYPIIASNISQLHNSFINHDTKIASAINNKNNLYESSHLHTNSSSSIGIKQQNSNVSLSQALQYSNDLSPFGGFPTSAFPIFLEDKEDDDFFHNPDPEEEAKLDRKRIWMDIKHMNRRSMGGWLGLFLLLAAGIFIFIVLPALTFAGVVDHHDPLSSGSAGGNRSDAVTYLSDYDYPTLAAIRTTLVDPDTPSSASTRVARDGSKWKLVFSDEFNAVGRTFYDGDDQFWTAPDIHYDATKDLEWYTPDAVTTANGTLSLRMDAYRNHDLYYRSGMVQSWNKMCFTEGALEISAKLPNYGKVTGLWPGLWTMGNLARPGYLASTEGVWPYSYQACDAGITPNQSSNDGISYLPGQKLNSCTCDGEDHPNQGTGRGAPEIDLLEGEVDTVIGVGLASQSLQVAPYDIWYIPDYNFIEIHNFTTTTMNSYCGGPFQQAVSAVTTLNTSWYEFGPEAGYYQKFAIEYLNDKDAGYIKWFVGDNPTMTLHSWALHPNGNIDWRPISKEPMSIIMNMGISNNWAYIDWQAIYFPVTFRIDYVRLYQPSDSISLTCDPDDYPTYDYIQEHLNAYSNANLTSWAGAGYSFPSNSLTGNCNA